MPLPMQGANASSTTDYEQLTYDAASNVTNRRLRDAQNIAFTYDNLNRQTLKNLPGSEPDVTYGYDNLGRLTSASQTGISLSFSYDALSRNLTQVGPQGTVSSQWDIAGRRTKLTYPGSGLFVDYDYLVTGEMTKIRENGATTGVGVLATFGYDDLGRRVSLTFGNGVVQATGFDPISRLASLTNELSGTSNDLGVTFAYNPASQITSTVRAGDNYAWTGHFNENKTGTANGLNQLTVVGPKTLTHDARGNVTAFGTKSFTYSSENLLLTGPGSTTLSYDPAIRLYQSVSGGTTLRLAYDGLDRVAEYNGSNTLQRRYVHGPGMDEPLVQYEGSGTTDRRFLSSDERGSIISVTDSSGAPLGINKYDEFGNPQSSNLGAFGYTGQAWLQGINVWYYKARAYDPEQGRLLQTDPIEYADSPNLYAYVGNDPVNLTDPLGLGPWVESFNPKDQSGDLEEVWGPDVTVIGERLRGITGNAAALIGGTPSGTGVAGAADGAGGTGGDAVECRQAADCIVVTGTRRVVPDSKLPPNSAVVLAGRRIFDEFGNFEGIRLPGYRVMYAPRGRGYLFVPPGYRSGTRNGIVRVQPPGTGSSSKYYPNGYYVVYDAAGRAIDVYTGQAHKDNSPLVHNPLGRTLPLGL